LLYYREEGASIPIYLTSIEETKADESI